MSIARALPTSNADGSAGTSPTRTGRYGEAYNTSISNKELFAADEGSHFVAINPTAGTGILGHAAPTTFDETKANLLIYNPGPNRVYLQSIKLVDTAVSVGGTRIQTNFSLDYGNLFTSGGTALVKNNVNADSGNGSQAILTAGAVVVGAATANRRLLGNHVLRGANIDVVWDVFEFVFGAVGGSSSGAAQGTTVAQFITTHLHPIVIGAGQMFKMVIWAASMSTGPTFEYLVNYIER